MEDARRPLVGWRSLAEAVSGGVLVQRGEEVVFASTEAGSILGVDPDTVVGESWTTLVPEAEHGRVRTVLERARDHDRWEGVVELGEDIGAGAIDVTVARPAQESAADAETLVWTIATRPAPTGSHEDDVERYETILDTLEDGVYALNEDLEFTYVNQGLCDLAGRTREQLLGTSALDLFTDEAEREMAAEVREQVVSGDANGGTLEATLPTADGDRHVESRFRLSPDADGEFRGSVGVLRDVTDLRDLQRELAEEHRFLQNVVDALEDVLYVVDEDGNFVFWNDVAVERTGYSDEEFAELHPLAFASGMPADEHARESFDVTELPDRYRLDLETRDGDVIPHELLGVTYRDEESDALYLVGVARDITDQLERKRELERQRDELATLDRINELILETVQELLTSANRDAVERAVCDRLANSDLYQFAWIGEPELHGDRIVPRVIAGDDRDYLGAVTITDDDGATGEGPIGRAMRTGEVQVANVDDPAFQPWREAARERGVESALAAPIRYGETIYGVLAVYANREDAFSSRERDAFDVLARAVGFAFHAARSRELLFADEIVELEFSLRTAESLFGNAAPANDCHIDLAGYVAADEGWVLYVEVGDGDPQAVADSAIDDPPVERIRVINETASGGRLEVVVGQSALLETVAAAGATVRSATATPDSARLVVEAPVGADVRDVVEMVTREYDGADLVARRECDREITSPARPGGLLEALTDRQHSALETAYRAGYFDWPRESTAEEVADSLSVAPATLHGHLRKAEKGLLQALFEER